MIVARLVAVLLVTHLVLEVVMPGAITVAAAAAAAAATTAAAAAGRACGPVAVVRGSGSAATMRAAIEGRLRADGLVSADPRTCPELTVRATVAPRHGAPFILDIEDAFGRRSRRSFDDAGTAASLIESFAFPEDSEVLRARSALASQRDPAPGREPEPRPRPPESPPESAPAGATPSSTPSPTLAGGELTAAASPPALAAASRFSLGASIGTVAASDHSLWYGGSLSLCARIGNNLCAGARAELARDFATSGPAVEGGNPSRTTGALLLSLGRPFRSPHLCVTPVVAVGLDWMRVAFAAQDKDPASSADVLGLRAEGILVGAIRLTASWSIAAEIVASLGRKLSHAESAGFASAASDNPEVDTNPLWQVRLGLGVEYAR